MIGRRILLSAVAGLLQACAGVPPSTHGVIDAYHAAFNAHDADAMGRYLHDDVQWFSIDDNGVHLASEGRETLVAESRAYFDSLPDVQSTFDGWAVNGDYVSVRETVSWTTGSGEQRRQAALSVYQLEADKVRRVWYFPATRVPE